LALAPCENDQRSVRCVGSRTPYRRSRGTRPFGCPRSPARVEWAPSGRGQRQGTFRRSGAPGPAMCESVCEGPGAQRSPMRMIRSTRSSWSTPSQRRKSPRSSRNERVRRYGAGRAERFSMFAEGTYVRKLETPSDGSDANGVYACRRRHENGEIEPFGGCSAQRELQTGFCASRHRSARPMQGSRPVGGNLTKEMAVTLGQTPGQPPQSGRAGCA